MDGVARELTYSLTPTDLGTLLVATTGRGVCGVELHDSESAAVEALHRRAPGIRLVRDDAALHPQVHEVLRRVKGAEPLADLELDVQGTPFQRAVWHELTRIPRGQVRTYGQVADAVGAPGAARAVGSACSANPVAVVVPCHRVVRSSGATGGYAGGTDRKRELLRREGARIAR